MSGASLKTKRILIAAVNHPCLCNLQIWVEISEIERSIHVGPCCSSCRRSALKIIYEEFGYLTVNFVD